MTKAAPILYIMRGVSGSGKSTHAKTLAGDSGLVFSTDEYFESSGRYVFDVAQLQPAHAWNKVRLCECVRVRL
jgi:shikimate kinase